MKRTELSPVVADLLKSAKRLAGSQEIDTVLLLPEVAYDFKKVKKLLGRKRLVIASDKDSIQEAVADDEIDLISLSQEPQTRQAQLGQALLEGIADELFKSGEKIIALYTNFDKKHVDTMSVISMAEQLARLSSRDLQRLETKVPLETLRQVVDLAVEIGREGREGKPVGALFVVGNHRKAMQMSHEQVYDPFKGYNRKDRQLRLARVRESVKELAQIDGAFIVSSDGVVEAAGRILDAPADGLTLSKGLGSRHWAAAAISKNTNSIAVAVSESTGTVRLFNNGVVALRIEPMARAMKWQDFDVDSPSSPE